jgi:DNA-binding CsgD family transcriptional regulator
MLRDASSIPGGPSHASRAVEPRARSVFGVDGADDAWLARLAQTADPLAASGEAWTGLFIDVSDPGRPRARASGPGGESALGDFVRLVGSWPAASKRGFVRRLLTGARCFTISARLDEVLYAAWVKGCARGVKDALCVAACGRPGEGILLWLPLPQRTRVGRRTIAQGERMAAEILASADRDPAGDAGASVPPSARVPIDRRQREAGPRLDAMALRASTRAQCRAADSLPLLGAEASRSFREELLAGRLRLLDHFDSEGRHYFVWDPDANERGRSAALTDREREVLGRVATGGGDRAIATELGCSPSTIATHRLRAMSKIGLESRPLFAQVVADLEDAGP